jgi:hypothetical protein
MDLASLHAILAAMRSLLILAVLGGTATAGPVGRVGLVGGFDTSAPGHREDGIALGAGYRYEGLTAQLDFAYLDYDGSSGVGGGATRLGALLQARLLQAHCHRDEAVCPHFDLDVAAGRRHVSWDLGADAASYGVTSTVERSGRELGIGVSATFGWHFSLHYVMFQPDPGPQFSCRGTCPMQVTGSDKGVLFEASFVLGGS